MQEGKECKESMGQDVGEMDACGRPKVLQFAIVVLLVTVTGVQSSSTELVPDTIGGSITGLIVVIARYSAMKLLCPKQLTVSCSMLAMEVIPGLWLKLNRRVTF